MADPTLETLVPERSTRRNATLVALAAVLLAGAWFLAPLLRPALVADGSGLHGARDAMPISLLRVTATGPLTVESVADSGPAEVAGAWLVPEADDRRALANTSRAASAEALLRASDIDPDAAALPHELADGETAWLMVAWRLTDCDATGDVEWGAATVRSPLGIERTAEVAGGGQAFTIDDAMRATCR